MKFLASSFREISPENTMRTIIIDGAQLGVTRVSDITHLDVIGIPAFSSVRIDADRRSLHVHNGKGARKVDAKVGAYAEAIEFALADPCRSQLNVERMSVGKLIECENFTWEFIDLCPLITADFDADSEILVTEANILGTDNKVLVPYELVVHPYPSKEDSIFGTSTNGLASGNTIDEAILHGIFEVLERDTRSWLKVTNSAYKVKLDNLIEVPELKDLVTKIHQAGLELVLCTVDNIFNLPYYDAYIIDPSVKNPVSLCYGSSVHIDRNVAITRAITEAAQSRLTYIHGGRDDITDRYNYYVEKGKHQENLDLESFRKKLGDLQEIDLPNRHSYNYETVAEVIKDVQERVESAGVGPVIWVDLSNPKICLKAVRVIIPGAEFFKDDFARIGRRLAKVIKENVGR